MVMMSTMSLLSIPLLFIFCNASMAFAAFQFEYKVENYGAIPDGKTDSTMSFLRAWSAACATQGPAMIYVEPGSYLLRNALFRGEKCNNNAITLLIINATLLAPSDYNNVTGNFDYWIKFDKVGGLSIVGGTLDGQGADLWACKSSGKICPKGLTTLVISNSNNVIINSTILLNSQVGNILVDRCNKVNLVGVKVIVPPHRTADADGIRMQLSSGVTVFNSHFAAADDCMSIGPGSTDFWIESVTCRSIHGISIESLGQTLQEPGVQNVTLKNVTFTGGLTGVRIKTWTIPTNAFVRDVHFQHLVMINTRNPIVIEQSYCPFNNCTGQVSGVKISNVLYQDIRGTSGSKIGVNIGCSPKNRCSGLRLEDITLTYMRQPTETSCVNVVESTGCP